MKTFCLALLGFAISAAAASKWDSVAVFHRPAKVLIQVNEAGANGRLQNWMTALGAGNQVLLQAQDKSFSMDCARNATAVNCAVKLLPSLNVAIGERSVTARFPVTDLGLAATTAFYEIGFLNSNGDHLKMKIENGEFLLNAGKRE